MVSLLTQLITVASQFTVNLFIGLSPLAVVQFGHPQHHDDNLRHIQRTGVVALFSHFGAGVFLSTCLIILIPESRGHFSLQESSECLEGLSSDIVKESFPLPELTVLLGFFLTFILEELSHYVLFHLLRNGNEKGRAERVRFCSCAKRHTECSRTFKVEEPDTNLFSLERKKSAIPGEIPIINRQIEQVAATISTNLLQSSIISQPNYGTNNAEPTAQLPTIPPPVVITNNGNLAIIQRHQPTPCRHTELTSSILLLISISILTFLQGIGIGRAIQESAWTLAFMLNLQQVLAVFVLGSISAMTNSQCSPVMFCVTVPCVMSTLASSLTMFVDIRLEVSQSVCGVVTAVVGGSLLYLTFCDILRREEVKIKSGFKTFFCFTLGSAVVAGSRYFET